MRRDRHENHSEQHPRSSGEQRRDWRAADREAERHAAMTGSDDQHPRVAERAGGLRDVERRRAGSAAAAAGRGGALGIAGRNIGPTMAKPHAASSRKRKTSKVRRPRRPLSQ